MTGARVPHPRDAVIARARDDEGHGDYWTAIYYGARLAQTIGRELDALDALTAVVTAPDGASSWPT